jgi:hypothetical protein
MPSARLKHRTEELPRAFVRGIAEQLLGEPCSAILPA